MVLIKKDSSMRRYYKLVLLITLVFSFAACATNPAGEVGQGEIGQPQSFRKGIILSIGDVNVKGENTRIGAVAGAVAGGLAGSKVSKDKTNRAIGVIGGAILGGLFGSKIEESFAGGKAIQFIVKPDNEEPFSLIQSNSEKLKVGERVLILEGSKTRITRDQTSHNMPKSSNVEIKTGLKSTGTGFLFSSSDYVITSYHVIHGASSIGIRLNNGDRIGASVILIDKKNDIAFLKLSQRPTLRQNIITLGNSSDVRTGDKVFTYGFPLVGLLGDAEPRYSEGFVNSLTGISNDPRFFQVSIPIQPGNSGGPVFNERGELVGMATSSIDSINAMQTFGSMPQNVNFAIKSSNIKTLLSNLPDAFIREKGIVPVPNDQARFKELVKNDIVLVEVVPQSPRKAEQPLAKNNSRVRSQKETIKSSRFNETHIKKLKSLNNCQKCNLSGANLSREKLKDANLSEANLSHANVSYADLSGAKLVKSNLTKANLESTDFRSADLSEANLSNTNLSKANLSYARLRGSNLDGANLVKANLRNARLQNASLKNSILTQANLNYADLTEANLSHASLGGANFKGATMNKVNLTGADLTGAELSRYMRDVNLTGANLAKANLVGVDFSGADLTRANLTGANLTGAKIDKATLCNTITPWGRDNSGC
ncbi:MAG: pentapeptide repeat-containing protein [Nitrospinaceae bacterium]|jgi:uncharacterized protein YjbI with pentapeptide repeats/S1-C subfamily serine protease